MTGPVGVGVDLASVGAVEASLERFGERYLRRVFTPAEVADCPPGPARPSQLAARFAAKEAVVKLLRPGPGEEPAWRDVEVLRSPGGAPTVRLHGWAERLADRRDVERVAVSMTHEAGIAAAVAVGTVRR